MTFEEWVETFEVGKVVWSIEMGGLGPGHEQAIQVAAFRIGRWLIDKNVDAAIHQPDSVADKQKLQAFDEQLDEAASEFLSDLQLTDDMHDAAKNLALHIHFRGGPDFITEAHRDRMIQVSKHWPPGKKEKG